MHYTSYPTRAPIAYGRHEPGRAARSDVRVAASVVLDSALAVAGATERGGASLGIAIERADARFDAAVRSYERGHWEQAFAELRELADQGHAPAAKLALLMMRYGATLYGTQFAAPPGQVARWARHVLQSGQVRGRHVCASV